MGILISFVFQTFRAFITILFFPFISQNRKTHSRILQAALPAVMYGAAAIFTDWRHRATCTALVILLWTKIAAGRQKNELWNTFCLITGAVEVSLVTCCAAALLCALLQYLFQLPHILVALFTIPVYSLIFYFLQSKQIFLDIFHLSNNPLYARVFLCGTALSFLMISTLHSIGYARFRVIALIALSMIGLLKFFLLRLFKLTTSASHADKHEKEAIQQSIQAIQRLALSSGGSAIEAAGELSEMKQEIDAIEQRDHAQGRANFLASAPPPSTGLILLDTRLKNFQAQCTKAGVELTVFVGTPLKTLLKEGHISREVLRRIVETLSDNALEAFSGCHTSADAIHIIMGSKYGSYCIEVLDNAPPFAQRILRNMGAARNTTDGNGSGLPDVIRAITPYHASFIIEELSDKRPQLTKSVLIRFDGQSQRLVVTKRPALLRLGCNKYGFQFVDPAGEAEV